MATRVSDALPRDELRVEPIPKWVRGELGREIVVDSRRTWLVWEPGRVVPGWCFPREDVRVDLLEPGENVGDHTAPLARVWALGDAEGAAWTYADPDLEGRIAVAFGALDRWLEEDVEVIGHPRDPFKRIDILPSSRHVRVAVGGAVLADSRRPLLLFETGLPVRYYLPREDVRMDLLEPSEKDTICAYKGHAGYFSAPGAPDIAWTYADPLPDSVRIRDAIAFFNERVDITVDGEKLERPRTPWS